MNEAFRNVTYGEGDDTRPKYNASLLFSAQRLIVAHVNMGIHVQLQVLLVVEKRFVWHKLR
jgi:hypothetical protein